MKKFLALGLLCFQYLCADQHLEGYLSYVKQLDQSRGNYQEGEIEIILDPVEISRVQKIQENRLLQKGFSAVEAAEYSRIGIVNEDQYWIWLRDAVYFPNAVPGTYNRLIWKSELKSTFPGVAVLPILPSGKIVLILNYRHATRSWELELPRGGMTAQETPEAAAMRELKEETGLLASSVTFLGALAADSGVLSSLIPVFIGHISAQEASNREYSEAIAGTLSFTKDELKEGLAKGCIEITIQDKKRLIPLRDPFLTFALLQAEGHKLL